MTTLTPPAKAREAGGRALRFVREHVAPRAGMAASKLWRIVRTELFLFLAIAILAFGVNLFIEFADDVLEGETRAFDESILLSLRSPADNADPIGPPWLEEAARDITALGSTSVLTLVTFFAVFYLVMVRKHGAALLLVITALGGNFLTYFLKSGFARPRPDLVAHSVDTFTLSFPSGHASLSAITYLTLGALLARVEPKMPVKLYLLGIAVLLTLGVGATRVYLGVHWPTDVIAGWGIGALWAAFVWMLALWLQGRGRVERDTPNPPPA